MQERLIFISLRTGKPGIRGRTGKWRDPGERGAWVQIWPPSPTNCAAPPTTECLILGAFGFSYAKLVNKLVNVGLS